MASAEKPSDIIQKARRKLAESLLQIEPDLILDAADSHQLLTQEEYFSLSCMKDPHGLPQSLIDTVLRKGESVHKQFLDCLENLRHAFPSLRPVSEYLENSPVNLGDESKIQSTAVLLVSGAENLNAAMPPEGRNEVENLEPSMSSETEKGAEKQDTGTMPSGTEGEAENPNVAPSLSKGSGVMGQDVRQNENGEEKPGAAATCLGKATAEDLAKAQLTTNTPESTLTGERSCLEETEQNLKGDVSTGPSHRGSVDSAKLSADEIICKGRKQLIEILHKDLEMVLDDLISQSVITEEDNEALDKLEEDPKKKTRKLLILVQQKGDRVCHQFLDRVEIAYPGARLALQCSIHGCSGQEQKAEVQQETEQEEKHPSKG